MSGFPNMEQIATLHEHLAIVAKENDVIARLQSEIEHRNLGLREAQSRRNNAIREVQKLVESMDCRQSGNTGFENRLLALLTGLSQHAEQFGRRHP